MFCNCRSILLRTVITIFIFQLLSNYFHLMLFLNLNFLFILILLCIKLFYLSLVLYCLIFVIDNWSIPRSITSIGHKSIFHLYILRFIRLISYRRPRVTLSKSRTVSPLLIIQYIFIILYIKFM